MIGFVHKLDDLGTFDAHKISCFYAAKDKKHLYEDQVALQLSQGKNASLSQMASEDVSNAIPKKRGAVNIFAEHEASESTDAFIKHINDNGHHYTWKANTCMLSTSHRDYKCEEDSETNNLIQISNENNKTNDNNLTSNATNQQATDSNATKNSTSDAEAQNSKNFKRVMKKNKLSGTKAFGEKTPEFALATGEAQKFRHRYSTIDDFPDSEVPKTFDLRNI